MKANLYRPLSESPYFGNRTAPAQAASFVTRIATSADLPLIADLRWRLGTDDAPIQNDADYARFIADFINIVQNEWGQSDVVHWVAVGNACVIATMSIVIVRKLPTPEDLRGAWGYISNSYALPAVRNAGVGRILLTAMEGWAHGAGLKLLVVWPSERAYSFYERAGFQRNADPLVRKLAFD